MQVREEVKRNYFNFLLLNHIGGYLENLKIAHGLCLYAGRYMLHLCTVREPSLAITNVELGLMPGWVFKRLFDLK